MNQLKDHMAFKICIKGPVGDPHGSAAKFPRVAVQVLFDAVLADLLVGFQSGRLLWSLVGVGGQAKG